MNRDDRTPVRGETWRVAEVARKSWDAELVEMVAGIDSWYYVERLAESSARTMLWCDARYGDDPDKRPEGADLELGQSDAERLRDDAESFVAMAWPWIVLRDASPEEVGHDLQLTRNSHGGGFWDGGYGSAGSALTEIAESLGPVCAEVSGSEDDGYSVTVVEG